MTTTEAEPVIIPDRIRQPAINLIGVLASRAGDLDDGMDALNDALVTVKPEDRTAVIAAALLITFAECITDPTDNHNNPVPVTWPDTTEGEIE